MDSVRMEYFTAAYCSPCKTIAPVIAELKAAGWNIEKIDVDLNQMKAAEAQIMGVPTFIIYKDNIPVRRFTGARQKAAIEQELKLAVGDMV